MERVFTELTEECDYTAQYYAVGFEKKEIAEKKHRSLHTIINQLRTAFEILGVRNGRELAIKLCERLCDIKANVNIQQMVHSAVACVLLLILCLALLISK